MHFQAQSLLTHLFANAKQELSTSRCVPCFANTKAFGKDIAKMVKLTELFCESHKNLLLFFFKQHPCAKVLVLQSLVQLRSQVLSELRSLTDNRQSRVYKNHHF